VSSGRVEAQAKRLRKKGVVALETQKAEPVNTVCRRARCHVPFLLYVATAKEHRTEISITKKGSRRRLLQLGHQNQQLGIKSF